MKQIIKKVLDEFGDTQINLGSSAARETISNLISATLKDKGTYHQYDDSEIEEQEARETWVCSICGKNTFDVENDYIGQGTNHLGCELELENDRHTQSKDWIKDGFDTYSPYKKDNDNGDDVAQALGHMDDEGNFITESIQKQIYNEMTADGLPAGGDSEAVMESHKLAEEIVNAQKGSWIYESPDGGKTVFRRPAGDYDPKNKEEIDWETKEPTGRVFSDYNNGNWKGDER